MAVVVMVDDERDNERRTDESTYYSSIRLLPQDRCLHGFDGRLGRLWCYRSIVLPCPVTLQIQQSMMQLLPLLVASLGARRSSIGRARARLHALYTARGMAGDCTRMAFEGVLRYGH
jgi:hypothetical protein